MNTITENEQYIYKWLNGSSAEYIDYSDKKVIIRVSNNTELYVDDEMFDLKQIKELYNTFNTIKNELSELKKFTNDILKNTTNYIFAPNGLGILEAKKHFESL
jgi:hypothetical protein